jgi:hypothetical protein
MEDYVMKPRTLRLLACIAFTLMTTACSRDPKPGTVEAAVTGERLMRSMSDALAQSKAFSFETRERLEVVVPNGDHRTLHFMRKVRVRRPNGLYFELHGEEDTALDLAAYYDGRTLTVRRNQDAAWGETAVPGTLDEMLDDVSRRFGLPIPIADVVYASPYDAFIGRSTKGGFVGRETIEGLSYAKLEYADVFVDLRIWLSTTGSTLPRRVEIVYKRARTPLIQRLEFSNWKLDAPVADTTFSFQPPVGHGSVQFGKLIASVVSDLLPLEERGGYSTDGIDPAPQSVTGGAQK